MNKASDQIDKLKERVKELPTTPGVYLMRSETDKIIYIGKAKNLKNRVRSYFSNNKDQSVKTVYLVNQIRHIDYMLTKTEVEAFLLEASLIKKHKPKYNIRLKDDKSYPYIVCNIDHPFPSFFLARKVKKGGAIYFGPYTSSYSVRETIKFINRTFKIRDCSDSFMASRKRPCMTYQINRCTGPCVGLISQEQYAGDIDNALEFLRGQDKTIVSKLTHKMNEASASHRYEAAAKFRDSLRAVEAIWEKQRVVTPNRQIDLDVVACFGDKTGTMVETMHVRGGRVIGNRWHFLPKIDLSGETDDPREWMTSFLNQYYSENVIPDEILLPFDLGSDIYKLLAAVFRERQGIEPALIHSLDKDYKELMEMAEQNAKSHFKDYISKRNHRLQGLEDIQAKLHLPQLPQRIECFDISNFQGEDSVASQVVFEEGIPKKEDYRRYKIKTVEGPNDYASMKEVLTRRLKHTEYEDPQLIVVDGGKGQLKIAVEVLRELGRSEIPVVGLAKARTQGEFSDKEVGETEERFFLPGRQNPVIFPKNSDAFQILVGLRDEAHRFAINYHRQLRQSRSLESELDYVVGLGEKRKKTLLKKYESIEQIKNADVNEIAELRGFNKILAERILLQLNED
ncbi:MAG: excinuclease ABC subunit UvrC [Bdellovibrionaceae bacterium]|nr:excinuclease ABC subunit UvrC [Pseudobdellovibrionaceae bacterium]